MYNGSRAMGCSPANPKTPPSMRPDSSYDEWKKEVEVWKMFTDLDKTKQGPALLLSLTGKAREAALELDISDISDEKGLDLVMERLDKLYLIDVDQLAFSAYEKFESYARSPNVSIESYLADFDHLYNNIKKYGMELPDGVLAYRMLKSASLPEEEEKLARATVAGLTRHDMSLSLRKIAGRVNLENKISPHIAVKEETMTCSVSKADRPDDEHETLYGKWKRVGYRGRGRGQWNARNSYRNAGKRNLNPMNKYGQVSRCGVCGSKFHWAAECPDKDKEGEEEEEVKITLMAFHKENSSMDDTFGCAVLDSGCTKTVCGDKWLENYINSLSEEEAMTITESTSGSVFRFGDGERFHSSKRIKLPCRISSKEAFVETDVVSCDIPLLLSKAAMKRANTTIDFANDKVVMLGQTLLPIKNSAGHYCVRLGPGINEVMLSFQDKTAEEKVKIAEKLHKQFAHASAARLIDLLKKADKLHEGFPDLLKNVERNCETCQKYKRPVPRPIVGLPTATYFNETVAMDLKSVDQTLFLHLVDVASRYSAAVQVQNKNPNTIIAAIFHKWISVFGPPKSFLSDNGGEFVNEKFISMAENFNIRIKTTAGESPWSNGVVERHNGLLGESIRKIVSDVGCSFQIALDWATSAKNSLQNHNGFSPNQIVFGRNPAFPNVETNEDPALESLTTSEVVAANLAAMHSARKEFIRRESCEKLRRALLRNVRNTADSVQPGDDVLYKRANCQEWKGPARVIGQDGQQIIVKHGGIYVRVHPTRIRLSRKVHSHEEDTIAEIPEKEETLVDQMSVNIDNLSGSVNTDEGDAVRDPLLIENEIVNDEKVSNYDNVPPEVPKDDAGHSEVPMSEMMRRPSKGQRIQFRSSDENLVTVEVLGRAGKATGRNKDCFNVKFPDGTSRWIDLSKVTEYREIQDDEEILMTDNYNNVAAKKKELDLWKRNRVYIEVEDNGQKTITSRWVITEKKVNNEPVIKARLVARGFEEGLEERTDSPTCAKETFRLALTIISMNQWCLKAMDVKAAFLQGDEINRDVFLIPPPEAETEKLWKLCKTVYGLNDAARAWYLSLRHLLESLGARASKMDNGLFSWYNQSGALSGVLCVHVDDICWGGTEEFEKVVIAKISQQLSISKTESQCFKYLGIKLSQDKCEVVLDQEYYVEELNEIPVKDKRKDRQLTREEFVKFRTLVGAINWVSSQTRPDAAFESCSLSSCMKHPCANDLLIANKVIRRMKEHRLGIRIELDGFDRENACLEIFADASFGNLNDGGSQGGYVIFLSDGKKRCAVAWQSKKLRRVVKSTFAAETMAMIEGSEAGIYLAKILKDSFELAPRIVCYTDNASLIEAIKSTTSVNDKRLRIDIAVLREMVKNEEMTVVWIPSHEQLADCLTKNTSCKDSLYRVFDKF